MLIKSIKNFSITNSIISGAYEAAIWYGKNTPIFTFKNNVVTNCNFFWVRPENTQPEYTFSESLIADNSNYMGYYTSNDQLITAESNKIIEKNIKKTGKVKLIEVETNGLPVNYLNPAPLSEGKELNAGIFKPRKN